MTPERIQFLEECVRRHTNIVPSLAAEALAHIQEQAALLDGVVGNVRHHASGECDCDDWRHCMAKLRLICAAAALEETTP